MTTEPIPEVTRLASLLEVLPTRGGAGPALNTIVEIMNHFGAQEGGLFDLWRDIDSLEKLINEIHTPAQKKLADKLVRRLKDIFSPDHLVMETRAFVGQKRDHMEFARENLVLFEELTISPDQLSEQSPSIISEIENLKSIVAKSEDISHAVKVIISSQLSLMERSISRFDQAGVGPFRESIFSIYGRIVFELERDESATKDAVRSIADDVLRVIGLIEAASGAVKLTGPVIAGLLTYVP